MTSFIIGRQAALIEFSKLFLSAWLTKLAKHIVLLACVMITSQAAGRAIMGQLGIFLLILMAVLIHSIGRALQRRFPDRTSLS